jgi:hypothetical protein
MKIKYMSGRINHWVVILFFLAAIPGSKAQDSQASDSRKALDEALDMFGGNADWKSDEFAAKVKNIITAYPASSEALTAKLFYAGHLQALQKPEDLNEEQRLYREITTTSPSSWQASIAWLNLAATYGFQDNYRQQLMVASTALSKIDFKALEASNDKDFQRLLALYSTPASDIEDALKLLEAKAQTKVGNYPEAQNILGTVRNEAFKEAGADDIVYQKKVSLIKRPRSKPSAPTASPSTAP